MAQARNFQLKLQIRDAALDEMKENLVLLKETVNGMTSIELNASADIATHAISEFRAAQKDVIAACPDPARIPELKAASKDAAKILMETMNVIGNAPAKAAPKRMLHPKEIKLDTFDGNFAEWAEWRGIFENDVLNTDLLPVEKIKLLLDALSGEAKRTAGRSEKRDEDELQRIWGKLVHTYDNPYQQVYAHITSILSLPKLKSPTDENFRNIINEVDEHMRLLERYGVLNNWSAIICVLLLQKLDEPTLYLWNASTHKTKLPNKEALFIFLTERSHSLADARLATAISSSSSYSAIPATPANSANQYQRYKQGESSSFRASRFVNRRDEIAPYQNPPSRICTICQKTGHRAFNCNDLISLPITQRWDAVYSKGLCQCCLGANHNFKNCNRGYKCSRCSDSTHATILCKQVREQEVSNRLQSN